MSDRDLSSDPSLPPWLAIHHRNEQIAARARNRAGEIPSPNADAAIASQVRNWLAERYLANPIPDHINGEPVVFERLEAFTGYVRGIGAGVMAVLERCRAAGWIADLRFDLTPTPILEGVEPPTVPRGVARLRLPMGSHRIIGIRSAVLRDAPPRSTRPTPGRSPTEADGNFDGLRAAADTEAPMPDGFFGAHGFRFRGAEVQFGKAQKQKQLVAALWDGRRGKPRDAKEAQEVIDKVYGPDNSTSDAAFRQLCCDAQRRLDANNLPLRVHCNGGKVWMETRPL